MVYTIIAPLRVRRSKKKWFVLNLNQYRNTHFQVLNKAKREYKAILTDQIKKLPIFKKIKLTYTLFPKTRRKTDIGNVLSIHQKFAEDSFVENGRIEDDDYLHIPMTIFEIGEVDPINPRVEITIEEIK